MSEEEEDIEAEEAEETELERAWRLSRQGLWQAAYQVMAHTTASPQRAQAVADDEGVPSEVSEDSGAREVSEEDEMPDGDGDESSDGSTVGDAEAAETDEEEAEQGLQDLRLQLTVTTDYRTGGARVLSKIVRPSAVPASLVFAQKALFAAVGDAFTTEVARGATVDDTVERLHGLAAAVLSHAR